MRSGAVIGTSMRRPRLAAATAVVGLAALVAAPHALAASLQARRVTNCDDSGAGSLRQAVQEAPPGGTVTFSVSCPPSSPITLGSTVDITRDVTIDGSGPGTLAVSGNHDVEVFDIGRGVTATIAGLTIEDGSSPYGGGVFNDGTLVLTESAVSDNVAGTGGGGIWNRDALTVTDSTLSDNSAGYYGGGISSGPRASLDVSDSVLSGDSVDAIGVEYPEYAYGGGIDADGTAAVTDSVFAGDSVDAIGGGGGGGGIYDGGSLNVTSSTFSDDTAVIALGRTSDDGGGAIMNGGVLHLSDTTLSGNSTDNDGGGIANSRTLTVTDSTLADNDAVDDGDGGGLFNNGTATVTASTLSGNSAQPGGGGALDNEPGGTLRVATTIVAGSPSGGDCSGTVTDGGYDLDDDGSCGLTAGSDHSDQPADLDPAGLQSNGGPTQTISLDPGSPAIAAVTAASLCSSADQRGVPRPTPCDIGSVELTLIPQIITFTSTPPPDATVGGPSYAVAASGGASGNPVVLAIDASASSVCSMAGSTVSFIGEGTCVIDADQAGNGSYSAAPQARQSFDVGPAIQAITSADAATATVGSDFSFTVTTSGSPSPRLTKHGRLPKGVNFTRNGNGTATLWGVPVKTGSYPITIIASFGKGRVKRVVTQAFLLTVNVA